MVFINRGQLCQVRNIMDYEWNIEYETMKVISRALPTKEYTYRLITAENINISIITIPTVNITNNEEIQSDFVLVVYQPISI